MKFIMSGHEGLIGRELKKRLESEGHECVLALDTRDKENPLDVKDIQKFDKKADVFFHLAANCKINKCIADPEWAFDNVLGVYHALEYCRKNEIKKFVNFSSTRVLYPEKNPYTSAKIYGEELCKAYKKCYNIDYIIIRPSTVYGPGEDPTNRLMNIWLNKALNNEPLEIYGDKDKTLDFTYIDDFVEGIMLAFNNPEWNKDYNLATGKSEKLSDVAEEIIKQTNSDSEIVFKDPETEQPQQVEIDISEIQKLGYEPKTDVYKGIKECVEYFKEKGNRLDLSSLQ